MNCVVKITEIQIMKTGAKIVKCKSEEIKTQFIQQKMCVYSGKIFVGTIG